MSRETQTEVLVVGAGPVGMVTALALAQQGIRAEIIDKEDQTAAHSYACALHPKTFGLLSEMGLSDELLAVGHSVQRIAFYEGNSRRAELDFSKVRDSVPFLLVVPQNEFEDILERKLAQYAALKVHWSHRLADLQPREGKVLAAIDSLTETAKGYPVATWQKAVRKTIHTEVAFVVGADGRDSHVRQLLRIEHDTTGVPESFAVFEFESDAKSSDEARVVLHDGTTNVLWPLGGRRWRWTFQIADQDLSGEAQLKNRLHFRLVDPPVDKEILQQMHGLIEQRAPWFDAAADELDWCTVIKFGHRVAKQYGAGRCWLAGDAAHSTGPIGMQSMNVGLREGVDLAHILGDILHRDGSLELLAEFGNRYRSEWRKLLGIENGVTPTPDRVSWAQQRGAWILPCVPASGDDFAQLLSQIGLTILQQLPHKAMTKAAHVPRHDRAEA